MEFRLETIVGMRHNRAYQSPRLGDIRVWLEWHRPRMVMLEVESSFGSFLTTMSCDEDPNRALEDALTELVYQCYEDGAFRGDPDMPDEYSSRRIARMLEDTQDGCSEVAPDLETLARWAGHDIRRIQTR
jgi:hypothetical protein